MPQMFLEKRLGNKSLKKLDASVAQLAEQLIRNQQVVGANPS